jgi:hypothetical protein
VLLLARYARRAASQQVREFVASGWLGPKGALIWASLLQVHTGHLCGHQAQGGARALSRRASDLDLWMSRVRERLWTRCARSRWVRGAERHRPRRTAVRDHRRHADLPQHLPHPNLAPSRGSQRRRLPRPRPRPPPRPRALAAGGADLKAVMERMGHSQIPTTQKPPHPPRHRPARVQSASQGAATASQGAATASRTTLSLHVHRWRP